eukprot:GHVT01025078.1.p1 GENE.GHVT01025078.1~~GHVT01025078.1.p1  ORF type:complete len:188 (+),score=19.96 GHVT01025078.1:217-780(+)
MAAFIPKTEPCTPSDRGGAKETGQRLPFSWWLPNQRKCGRFHCGAFVGTMALCLGIAFVAEGLVPVAAHATAKPLSPMSPAPRRLMAGLEKPSTEADDVHHYAFTSSDETKARLQELLGVYNEWQSSSSTLTFTSQVDGTFTFLDGEGNSCENVNCANAFAILESPASRKIEPKDLITLMVSCRHLV